MRAAFRTTAFRTAAVYTLVSAALLLATAVAVSSICEHEIHAEMRAGIGDETEALVSLLKARGPQALGPLLAARGALERPLGGRNPNDPYFALADRHGRVVAGDLARLPRGAPVRGWYRFTTAGNDPALGLITPLGNGTSLLVAQSLAPAAALSGTLQRWIAIVTSLALLAGLLAGAAVGRNVMRQIAREVAAAERVRSGRLGERLPVHGPEEQSSLARAVNAVLDQIETAIFGLRDLAARSAHEIQGPLMRTQRLLAQAQALRDTSAVRRTLASAREEVVEMSRRVDALLRLSRIESGTPREYPGAFDLARVGRDIVDLYAALAEECGGSMRFDGPQTLTFKGDRQLLAQALANLVDNAVKHAPGGSTVVRLCDDGRWHILEVATTSSRSATAGETANSRGSGLGLRITNAIARLHGGTLTLGRSGNEFSAQLRLPADGARRHAGPCEVSTEIPAASRPDYRTSSSSSVS